MPSSTSRISALTCILVAAIIAVVTLSCASVPTVIPDGLSPAELNQQAQDLYDRDQYEGAIRYYQAIKDRFPTDLGAQCGDDYEISFIRYKQNRFEDATAGFRALLERYKTSD
ncbi:MAG: hypothetical protein WCT14_02860, partial [Treponemataceae bacterium]